MTSRLEFEGKNVEMAVRKACKALDIGEEKLKYEVLSYGSTGIFGLVGVKKARIKVNMPKKDNTPVNKVKPSEAEPIKADAVTDNRVILPESPAERPAPTEALEAPSPLVDLDAVAIQGKSVLQDLLSFISEGTAIDVETKNSRICYSISGGDSGILIGKRGQTLDAIQYLMEKIINKSAESRVKIDVDVEGYLESRKENLKDLAIKLSKKAKKTGKPVTVGHMSAHDRRIIHVTLKNDKKVRTQSMGDGFLRKIVIFPKRRPGSQRPRNENSQNNPKNGPKMEHKEHHPTGS